MDTILSKRLLRTLVLAVCLGASAGAFAHGGWHGGGGGWHGGGWHGGGWHGGGWHGGGWHGGGWYGGSGVIIGNPGYYGCQNVRVCNNRGSCWIQRSCY